MAEESYLEQRDEVLRDLAEKYDFTVVVKTTYRVRADTKEQAIENYATGEKVDTAVESATRHSIEIGRDRPGKDQ